MTKSTLQERMRVEKERWTKSAYEHEVHTVVNTFYGAETISYRFLSGVACVVGPLVPSEAPQMSAIVCSKSSSTYARACFWESSYANNRAVLFRISAAASFHSLPEVNRLIAVPVAHSLLQCCRITLRRVWVVRWVTDGSLPTSEVCRYFRL